MMLTEEEEVEEEDRSRPGSTFCGSRLRRKHMDISQRQFSVEIYGKSAIRQSRDSRFVRACAIEMHMDMDIFTRAVLCGNLQGISQMRMRTPR